MFRFHVVPQGASLFCINRRSYWLLFSQIQVVLVLVNQDCWTSDKRPVNCKSINRIRAVLWSLKITRVVDPFDSHKIANILNDGKSHVKYHEAALKRNKTCFQGILQLLFKGQLIKLLRCDGVVANTSWW